MDYQEFIEQVSDLEFIGDMATADAAVKAVLGILVSRLKESQAYRLAKELPLPLSYDRLRGHQGAIALMISFEQYVKDISAQFKLTYEQAFNLVNTVLHLAKNAIDRTTLEDVITHLPSDWSAAVANA